MVSTKAAAELVTALSLAVASAVGFWVVLGYPDASKLMPVAIMSGTFLLSVIWIAQLLRSGQIHVQARAPVDRAVAWRLVVAFSSLALMLVGVSSVGFFTTYIVCIPLTAWLLGYRSVKGIALGTAIFCAGLYLIFKVVLNRPLPLEIWMLGT